MTKKDLVENEAKNNVLDRIFQGGAAAVIIALSFKELMRHISATAPVNYILAGMIVVFLVYSLLAPMFRK